MKPECPHYTPPRLYVDYRTDKDFEGSAMCELSDNYCLVEYSNGCEIYDEFLAKVDEEED
jgi:hypothetical protein